MREAGAVEEETYRMAPEYERSRGCRGRNLLRQPRGI